MSRVSSKWSHIKSRAPTGKRNGTPWRTLDFNQKRSKIACRPAVFKKTLHSLANYLRKFDSRYQKWLDLSACADIRGTLYRVRFLWRG
ncbi:hypothetical protein COCC4DRAFT_205124 [Bipolaris maydis ATCC 48331]|uniref:Uncharacterized protein n=2 Tax=Cochliobolus heterostrophus TaxID=5016 RepID=M2U9D2_COCH5|nr:uncharacterized protein COCC4DRAFT_205124 [Bipolaris maydis ATCC 48331]EMD95179.1 hypothetical protein COCHEDRAFT_1191903 [Bipolaris maydis C5]ENI00929.1 hypothetical protein COCC4DRAFT_205124 [Bipolaris maydis ATCC 48331]